MRTLILIFSILILSSAFGGEAKVAVPDAAKLKEAETLIKDIFKDDYAKRAAEDKKALGAKLLQQGNETKDDPASRYVLLKEAAALAAAGGDAETAAKALDALGESYEVDVVALKAEAFAKIVPATPDAAKALSQAYLKAIDEAVAGDSYDGAVKLAAAAETVSRKTQDMPLVTQVTARARDVRALQADFAKVKTAQATLKDKPDDPEANLAVGRFMCFTKGDWDGGLPFLAKSANNDLKTLATTELAQPAEAAAQMALADAWWDYGQKATPKAAILERALLWYERCRPNLTGLTRVKVDKRIATPLPSDGKGGATAVSPARAEVVKVLQAKAVPQGLPKDALQFDAPKGDGRRGANGFWIPAAAEWEIRGTKWEVRYQRNLSAEGVHIIHPFRTGHVMITLSKERLHLLTDGNFTRTGYTPREAGGLIKTADYAKAVPIPEDKQVLIVTMLDPNGNLQIHLDDKLVASGTIKTALPFTFGDGFVSKVEGTPMPKTLPLGHAALIIGPVDGGINKAQDAFFYPFVPK